MVRILEVLTASVGTLLELYLVFLLLRGPFRKYLLFFSYIACQLVGDGLEAFAFYYFGHDSRGLWSYRTFYWADEITSAVLLFLVLATFTYEALKGNPLLPKAKQVLTVVVVLTLAAPFVLIQNQLFSGRWFSRTDQVLNFGVAIMDLVLWTALLLDRRRDQQLLTISMGVGIAAASAAMMWGARLWVAKEYRWPMDTFAVLMHIASLVLWCWAFRPQRTLKPPQTQGGNQSVVTQLKSAPGGC